MNTESTPAIEIAFIIVNYNTAELLHACLASIILYTPYHHEIILVDNHSNDGSCEMVEAQFPAVKLIQNKENLGFPKAVNQGLQAVSAPFYFILNSDVLMHKNTVKNLYDYLSQKPNTGIAAPAQFLPDGHPILTLHLFPNLWREWMRNLLFTDVWKYRICGRRQAQKIKLPVSVDWVIGAALFVRAEMIADIGYMDEAIFLYGEELDWCYRAHQAGWFVDFVPEATLIHHKSASADKALNSSRYERVVRSNYYVNAKCFGIWQLPLFIIAQIPVVNMSKRWTFIIGTDLKIRAIEKDVDPVLDAQHVAEALKKLQ
jgi:GT2 family glycosyltransferase